MSRAAIDLAWHDVVAENIRIINLIMQGPEGLESCRVELSMQRNALHQVVKDYYITNEPDDTDGVYGQLFDALSYFNEALCTRPVGRGRLDQVVATLENLRDLAIPY